MSTRKTTPKPTAKELEILKIVSEKAPVSVKDVHEQLGGETANGYTTILKLMQIMHEKGHVTRQKSGKLHLYQAMVSQAITQQSVLDKMIDSLFEGSASQLVLSALGSRKSTKSELKAIRDYLDQLEGGTK